MLRQSFLVGAGGFLGSCLRYWAGLAGARLAGAPTPWATAFVNVTGCLAIGFLSARMLSPELRAFCLVGVLGGYTTFSTFGLETWSLLEQGRTGQALASVLVQVGLGLVAVASGLALGRGAA